MGREFTVSGMGSTGRHCDEITDAIDRMLADADLGGFGGVAGGGNVRPSERPPQPEQWGLSRAEADALRESVELLD